MLLNVLMGCAHRSMLRPARVAQRSLGPCFDLENQPVSCPPNLSNAGRPKQARANPIAGSRGMDRLQRETVLGEVLPKPVGVVRCGARGARSGEQDAAGFRQ